MQSSASREDTCPPVCAVGGGRENIRPKNVEFHEATPNVYHGYAKDKSLPETVTYVKLCEVPKTGRPSAQLQENCSFSQDNQKDAYKLYHLLAGGIAGCVASIATCPLDVIKTRQQASAKAFTLVSRPYPSKISKIRPGVGIFARSGRMQMTQVMVKTSHFDDLFCNHLKNLSSSSIPQHFRNIIRREGPRALYKGLGPTLAGVVPSRAIYFFAYSNAKSFFTKNFNISKDSSSLHLLSATSAGLCGTTVTSPLWVIKTKLQLHRKKRSMTVRECCSRILQADGLKGFYRGMTASYAGVLETVIHFMIYERLKILHMNGKVLPCHENDKTWRDYTILMAIAALSKTTATCIAYPHEVIRTRLREETRKKKYRGFFQTIFLVSKQEGIKALYRGLGTQIVRQVPNMAIVMGTYELIIDASSRL